VRAPHAATIEVAARAPHVRGVSYAPTPSTMRLRLVRVCRGRPKHVVSIASAWRCSVPRCSVPRCSVPRCSGALPGAHDPRALCPEVALRRVTLQWGVAAVCDHATPTWRTSTLSRGGGAAWRGGVTTHPHSHTYLEDEHHVLLLEQIHRLKPAGQGVGRASARVLQCGVDRSTVATRRAAHASPGQHVVRGVAVWRCSVA
jgi:hypothetical protein